MSDDELELMMQTPELEYVAKLVAEVRRLQYEVELLNKELIEVRYEW